MSRLDELIQEYCPDGVTYSLLGNICEIKTGKGITKKDSVENGDYPIISGGKEPMGNYHLSNRKADTVTISRVGANAGFVNFIKTDFYLNDKCFSVIPYDRYQTIINSSFLYECLKNIEAKIIEMQSEAGVPTINTQKVASIEIPVPPLPVQEEIVRILDRFTALTVELQDKLQAELQARKRQYEYYLNQFYEKQTDNLRSLESVGQIIRGKRFVHADATDNGVPCIHYGELYTYYGVHADKVKSHIREELRPKMRYAHKGDVIIVGAGENNVDIGVGVAWEGNEDVAVHDACYTLSHSQNSKYISYYLRSDMYHKQIKKYVSEGKICSISASGLGKALIPLAPISEQERIVSILDRFDSLCNDLTSGLPAEIEARQKQYEYYRDKLLTFKPLP